MNGTKAIGIDIGGTNTVFGLVDHRGNVLSQGKISTKKNNEIDVFVDTLFKEINRLIRWEKKSIKGIGVGAPDVNIKKNSIEFAHNLPWKGIVPLGKLFEDKFKLPVQLINDAKAAAIGEMTYGAAKGMNDFIMITLGTGLGSGIVINGHIVYGHDGFAGELGHVIIEKNGRPCGCGRKGCLETYVSANGLIKTTLKLLQEEQTKSILRKIPPNKLSSRIIAETAAQGDPISVEALDETTRILGQALANFIAFSAPEAIILFGGLANAGDLILKPAKKYMEENLPPIWKNKIKLIRSDLEENEAAILGASALVWNKS